MIKSGVSFFLLYLSTLVIVKAQCGSSNFTVPTNNCINKSIAMTPDVQSAFSYEWDFCPGELSLTPTASVMINNSQVGGPYKVKVIEQGGLLYGFVTSRSSEKMFRLDFGTSINNVPTIVDLGKLGIGSSGWLSVDIVKEGSIFYGFVIDVSNKVYRFEIGSSLSNQPGNGELIYSGGLLSIPIDLVVVEDGAEKFAFVANYNANSLTRIQFTNSFSDAAGTLLVDNVVIGGSGGLVGVSFLKECDTWFALTTSKTNDITRIEFSTGLAQVTPPMGQLTGFGFPVTQLGGISVVMDNGNYYAFIQSLSSNLYRIDFGNSLSNSSLDGADLGNFGILSGVWAYSMFKYKSDWLALSSENGGPRIFKISFPQNCLLTPAFSTEKEPSITASGAGDLPIALSTKDALGASGTTSKEITILNKQAPILDFLSDNICANHDINFLSLVSSGTPTTYDWQFGDMQSSSDVNPTHQFTSSGEYSVSLQVTIDNGCDNFVEKTVKIYDPPTAGFTFPSGLICTNNEFTFLNTTVDNFDGNLTYQWLVDDVPTSTQRDLLHTFITGGDKEITLQTSIPGCSSESIQVLTGVGEGPVVDFSIEGVCLNEEVHLTNGSTGDIASYAWDFGDGQLSTETSPTVSYATIGTYAIELETTGNNGCVSTKTVNHQIFSVPQPNFNTDLPPFSCNGTPTQFNDLTPPLTDSNLESWLWDFNDNGATANVQSPTYTYALSGAYDVTLTVTSDQGCSGQLTKNITIAEAPSPTIVNTPACVDTGVEFATLSAQPIVEWQWRMGNSYYFTENPSHVFDEPGNFSVSLMVTGQNGCLNSSSKDIFVPEPIEVDFTSSKKCVDADAQFVAVTNAQDDLPGVYEWTLDGVVKQGEAITHAFKRADLYEVLLRVTAESGCVYSLNKAQTVLEKPIADFSFSPKSGSPPLSVQFTNASINASSYSWHFNDAANSTSTSVSPNFIFTEIGDYPVDLLASNEEGCESTVSKVITVALPLLFVSLNEFEVIQDQSGLLQMRVTVNNEGNVDLQNMPLAVSLNNGTELYETVPEILLGGESKTIVLTTRISKTPGLQFLCLTLELDNNSAGATEELCLSLEGQTIFIAPHPNPAKDIVTLDWVALDEEKMTLSVVNTVGKEMLTTSFLSQQGLNSHVLSTTLWQEGLYFFKVQASGTEHTFRIIIVR